MSDFTDAKRRRFLQNAFVGTTEANGDGVGLFERAKAKTAAMPNQPVSPSVGIGMDSIRRSRSGRRAGGPALHGYPYDIHSYVEVAPMFAAQGYRVIVPFAAQARIHALSRRRYPASGSAWRDRRGRDRLDVCP